MEKYKKDFDAWNGIKKRLENRVINFTCYEREIWWCSIGLNIGSEQDGKNELFERPVLVLKKFNHTIFWILPMTSRKKHENYYNFLLNDSERANQSVILSQLRLVSIKRFHRLIGKMSMYEFALLKGKIGDLLVGIDNFKARSSAGFTASLYPEEGTSAGFIDSL